MNILDRDPLTLIAAFALAVVAVGRAARLATHDDWPPGRWVRTWWVRHTGDSWGPLWLCPFCWAPYAAAIDLTWAVLSNLDAHRFWGASWWIINTWAALSYLAAILVARDEPPEE